MSRDIYGREPQEAAARIASSIFSHGLWCMNECAREYATFLKAASQLSGSYMKILYGSGDQTVKQAEAGPSKIVIPIHEIKEVEYKAAPAVEPGPESPMVQLNAQNTSAV